MYSDSLRYLTKLMMIINWNCKSLHQASPDMKTSVKINLQAQTSILSQKLDELIEIFFDDKKLIAEIKARVIDPGFATNLFRIMPRPYYTAIIKKATNKHDVMVKRLNLVKLEKERKAMTSIEISHNLKGYKEF